MYERLLRPLLFGMSRDDPEKAHIFAKRVLRGLQDSPLLGLIASYYQTGWDPNPTTVAGITFPNRVGLAAGFDKDAEVLLALQALGFGFIEIGSILPRYQKGNDRPRMFRFPKHEALLNRMGFNSLGVETAVLHLEQQKSRIRIPIIGSLGKMKETSNENAVEDYKTDLRRLRSSGAVGAYTANVSSPNTPGLRELQGGKYLEHLVRECVGHDRQLSDIDHEPIIPLLVKIAPDLTDQEIAETVGAAVEGGAKGIIATNTTVDEQIKAMLGTKEAGGVSGDPLFPRALAVVKRVRTLAPKLALIGVGGVNSKDRAQMMFDAGADLVQIFAGFIYKGPRLIQDIRLLG